MRNHNNRLYIKPYKEFWDGSVMSVHHFIKGVLVLTCVWLWAEGQQL
ncbi:MAG: hypothetical protein JNN15_01695 [Blastocatellia bacterium]|nr:hypothetical protein [Blastocatellia bacterium]